MFFKSTSGENGPTAYIIEKNDATSCKFTWLLNVDLKVNDRFFSVGFIE